MQNRNQISPTYFSLTHQKRIKWHEIKAILEKQPRSINDSLLRQAIKRACLDTNVCQSCLSLLLQNVDLSNDHLVNYCITAARCHNVSALETIIHNDVSILYQNPSEDGNGNEGYRDDDIGMTLLHRMCSCYGWNDVVAFILKETLANCAPDGENPRHDGMYEAGPTSDTPLKLALQEGAELREILQHLIKEYPRLFERKLYCLPEIIAEYCYDMTLLKDLLNLYPDLLHSLHPSGCSPLHFACYYQNSGMVQTLLGEYREQDGRKALLRNRLLALDEKGMSPLGQLIVSVGDRDDGSAWKCIGLCLKSVVNKTKDFPFLHLLCDHMIDTVAEKPNSMKIIRQIVTRLNIDLCHMDEHGRSVLSTLIMKLASCKSIKAKLLLIKILHYVLEININTAFIKDASGRLPLHLACDHALLWKDGLESLVLANVAALNEYDPISKLAPFALASRSKDLETIYGLVRKEPSLIKKIVQSL